MDDISVNIQENDAPQERDVNVQTHASDKPRRMSWMKMQHLVVPKQQSREEKKVIKHWTKYSVFSKLKRDREKRFGVKGSCCIFDSISLHIPVKKDRILSCKSIETEYQCVLNNISGIARPGELYGIIGSSGAGKSSLFEILSGNIDSFPNGSKVHGTVQLGADASCALNVEYTDHRKVLRTHVGIVSQADIFQPVETVKEIVEISSILRLYCKTSALTKQEKKDYAAKIIHDLELTKCQDTIIGDHVLKGISGGERKRCNIAVELVANPTVLLLDEPTSSLDSVIAVSVMQLLKKIAVESGKAIMLTIHQPSAEIFEMLDQVLILAQGHVVYEGTVPKLHDYLQHLTFECPQYHNIADYVLKILSENTDLFIAEWKQYLEKASVRTVVDGQIVKRRAHSEIMDASNLDEYQVKFASVLSAQFPILLQRELRLYFRDNSRLIGGFIFFNILGLIAGSLWHDLKPMDEITDGLELQVNIQDRYGLIFFSLIAFTTSPLMTAVLAYSKEKQIFEQERKQNWYFSVVWILSKTMITTPFRTLFVFVYCLYIKFLCNMAASLWSIFAVMALNMICSDAIGFVIGVSFGSVEISNQVGSVLTCFMALTANFWLSLEQIPGYWHWFKHINPTWYSGELLALYEFDDGSANGVGNIFELKGIDGNDKYSRFMWMVALVIGYRILGALAPILKNGI
eukprot:861821_1